MGGLTSVSDANLLSINRLSQMTGMARETVARKIQAVKPAGKRSGHPVYRLGDVGTALFGPVEVDPDDIHNPAKMHPRDRKDYFLSELGRLEYETELGTLLSAEDVRHIWAETLKKAISGLETLSDVVERDAGLTPEQVAVVDRVVDQLRQTLYQDLTDD